MTSSIVYTLFDGRKKTSEELTAMYIYNKTQRLLPVAGYFCPKCYHEIGASYMKEDFICPNCLNKEQEN